MPPPTSSWMRISELSRRVGVPSDTLRVWERRYGLLAPRRTAGNIRLYSTLDEARVRLMTWHLRDGVPAAQAAAMGKAARLTLRPGATGRVQEHDALAAAARMSRALDAFDESGAERRRRT